MAGELVGIIGGSGLGDVLAEQLKDVKRESVGSPFGKPSDEITIGKFGDRRIAFINRHGPGHIIGPSDVPFAANIFALKTLGVHAVIATGAVGSLREEIEPGDLVVVDQFIDKTFKRTSTFFSGYGAVHCEMADPVCYRLREIIIKQAEKINVKTYSKGTYVCMEGPQFSTKAESNMHRGWGGDLIGMTAMPEAKLAREAQMCYCLVALASDYDCWRPHDTSMGKHELLKEIIANMQSATKNCLKLIEKVLAGRQELVDQKCHCRKSLELAVWTNPDNIADSQKEKLKVLFE